MHNIDILLIINFTKSNLRDSNDFLRNLYRLDVDLFVDTYRTRNIKLQSVLF